MQNNQSLGNSCDGKHLEKKHKKQNKMNTQRIIFFLLLCYLSKHAIARQDKTTSFGCRCGNAKVGASDKFRKKRQTTNYALDVFRSKRDIRNTEENGNKTLENLKKAEGKLLNDEYSRIVNGYEPERRPWIILLLISR